MDLAATIVPARARSRVPLVVGALVVLTGGYVAMLALRPGGAATVVQVSDVATTIAAGAAAVACAAAGRPHHGWLRAFWWLLAAACLAWATGEAIWTWYEVVLDIEVPYPSWADVGYLTGTPLAVAAFACHPSAHDRHERRLVPLLDGVAVASALLFVSWTLVLGPLWSATGGISRGDLVAVAYPFGDVVILVLVVLALRGVPAGNRATTALLLGGLLLMAVSDSAYTYLAQENLYSSGDLLDAGWFASYLAIAAAALVDEPATGASRTRTSATPLRAVVAPYLPILVALVVIAVEVPRGRELDRFEWCIAVCLTVVVAGRQALYVVQRRAAHRPAGQPGSRPGPPAPAGRPVAVPVGARQAASAPGTPGMSLDTRAELHVLTLQMVAAARSTPQERARRVSSSMVMALTSAAGLLALWDLGLLVRGAG